MKIEGTTALVTGATGGIGAAIARSLASHGARLILSGRRRDVLEALASELDARALVIDLADRADLTRLIDETGDIDILVANAALPGSGRIIDFESGQIDSVLDVNLRAPILMAHALTPLMIGRGRGHFVFVNSLSGKAATPRTGLYAATKFGLRGFAQALREDLTGTNVGVSSIFPGFIRDAGMFADSGVTLPTGIGTRTPDDVARAVLRGIEDNVAEIDVAPLAMRLGVTLATIAPGLSATVQRAAGADTIAESVAAGQRDKV